MRKQIDNSLYNDYSKKVIPELKKMFKVKNEHDLPEIEKIIVNMGLKKAVADPEIINEAKEDLSVITGRKPIVTKAKKAVSNFGIKAGDPIGCKVTLRGKIMYVFLEKLLRVVIPRIRDFSGLKRSFDPQGNLTIGVEDESIFPEIDVDKIKNTKGLSITIVTDKKDRKKSEKMFELLGVPFIR